MNFDIPCNICSVSICLFQGDATGSKMILWIGLSKAADSQWHWISNRKKADYIPCDTVKGQPSNYLGEQYACYVLTSLRLHDCSYRDRRVFMCEMWRIYHIRRWEQQRCCQELNEFLVKPADHGKDSNVISTVIIFFTNQCWCYHYLHWTVKVRFLSMSMYSIIRESL